MEERDPDFARKAVEVIELELNPPTDGPTFCVDEKTGIGVRRPAALSQPVSSGRPARREFEYVRNGTADLRAAFSVRNGQVTGIVRRQHRRWYRDKAAPSFPDMLTALRRAGWRQYLSAPPCGPQRPQNPLAAWPVAVLATA